MKIRFVGARAREVAAVGHAPFIVEPGQVVDVPAALGLSLLDQPQWFQAVKETKTEKEKDS